MLIMGGLLDRAAQFSGLLMEEQFGIYNPVEPKLTYIQPIFLMIEMVGRLDMIFMAERLPQVACPHF